MRGRMKLTKKNRPYYAKWWFFMSLISLGWLTPVTKNWYLFLFGETTIAYPVNIYEASINRFYYRIFHINGVHYVGSIALNLSHEIPEKCIKIYFDKKKTENNISFNLTRIYTNQKNLFFPLGLQIGLGVFFLLARFKNLAL